MKTIKLKSGTELPLMNLKGKDYLQVAYRLVWFREEHPDWSVETDFIAQNEQSAVARAIIKNEQGRVIATSHKEESSKDFAMGHREKAETGAIGRALALCGYGTQFEPEFDEESRVVDSPLAQDPNTKGMVEPGNGIQKEGPRVGACSKDLVALLGCNPAGKLVSELHQDVTHKFIGYLEERYANQEWPMKAKEMHDHLVSHAIALESE